jgi:hypothetical protein
MFLHLHLLHLHIFYKNKLTNKLVKLPTIHKTHESNVQGLAHSYILDFPFNYMFFTPLYSVRNTGCPQISKQKCSQIYSHKTFFF